MDLASIKTINNKEKSQFELHVDGQIAFISYKQGKSGDVLYMVHTEVPDGLEGHGVGHKLVRESLSMIEKEALKIIPLCPFVKSFVLKNREDYGYLLSEKFKL